MKKPNFFIVGAPKAGTTAFYEYLRQHPDIFMSQYKKEPHYFAKDLHRFKRIVRNLHWITEINDYLELFESAESESRIGEASVFYLYSETAAREIYRFNPQARIIIMLRKPAELMYSMHSTFLLLHERHRPQEFRKALEMEKRGEIESGVPDHERSHISQTYAIASFLNQVKRFIDIFPREQIHFILYDDIKNDTSSVYRDTLRFLQVDDTFQPRLNIINKNKTVRSHFIHQIVVTRPLLISKILRLFTTRKMRQQISLFINELNYKEFERSPMDPILEDEISEYFKKDIIELSGIIERDLSNWLKEKQ